MTKVKAAVLERSRRSTAGKRMSSLMGKAQEDDDAFWSHSIWSESGGGFAKGSRKRRRDEGSSSSSSGSEGGSDADDDSDSDGEGSYRMSDEDPDMAVDRFDSDFDESETEDEEDDGGEGEEEMELRAEERRAAASKRKKNQRLGVPLKASAGRELMKKRTGRMTKRGPMGEGWNEGLVLNWPPPSGGAAPAVAKPGAASPIQSTTIPVAQGSASVPVASPSKPQHIPSKPVINLTQISKLRFPPSPKRHLRAATASTTAPPAKPASKRQTAAISADRKRANKKRQFTQEELILECIKSTETENAKWLSSRKRGKEEAAKSEKAAADGGSNKSSSHQVSRFHSRRGCSNTLTFMDMDRLPDILTRRHASHRSGDCGGPSHPGGSASKRRRLDSISSETVESPQATDDNRAKCVITGKVARYRDPKTMLGYHDIDAFKELRRRFETGELAVSQPLPGRRRTSSNNRVNEQRIISNDTTIAGRRSQTHFPFAVDQPTMVAETKPNGPDLKVMVTQDGVPVSPPRTKIRLKFPGRPQGSAAEASQYRGDRKEPPPPPPLVTVQSNGRRNATMGNGAKTNDVPEPVISNPQQPSTDPAELRGRQYRSEQPIEQATGVQQHVAVGSRASDAGTEGKVEIVNGGPNKKAAKSPAPAKGVSRSGSADGGEDDDIVPERTTSNGKRTTIEAN